MELVYLVIRIWFSKTCTQLPWAIKSKSLFVLFEYGTSFVLPSPLVQHSSPIIIIMAALDFVTFHYRSYRCQIVKIMMETIKALVRSDTVVAILGFCSV